MTPVSITALEASRVDVLEIAAIVTVEDSVTNLITLEEIPVEST